MNEELKYQTIKLLVDTHENKKTAALRIGCSLRHINRLINGYRKTGKTFFVHGNQGRQPAHTVDSETKQLIIDLYRTRYYGTYFQHFQELLGEHEAIQVSISVVRSALASAFILSPKACRITKKNLKNNWKRCSSQLLLKNSRLRSPLRFSPLRMLIPAVPVALSLAKCCKWMLPCIHWFGDEKSQLHIAVDDATNTIVGAYFDRQETLNGYYHILHQILNNRGITYMFFTDRRTVFEYKQKNHPLLKVTPLLSLVMPASSWGLI